MGARLAGTRARTAGFNLGCRRGLRCAIARWGGEAVAIALVERRGKARLSCASCSALIGRVTRFTITITLQPGAAHHPFLMQVQLPPQTVSSLKSVHLLRALLREASYLPDANARQYFRRYIVNRFRAYQPAQNASSSLHAKAVEKHRHRFGKRRHISVIEQRTQLMQRKARKGLNYLRLANLGHYRCLRKILYFTYGRIGTRKYVLLDHLLRPDDPTAVQEPSPLQKLYYSNERFLSFFDAPKKSKSDSYSIHISDRYSRLRTAIKAQHHKEVALNRELKRSYLLTPINNIWERPMPIKRARNNVRRWYAETMTRLLPPLPTEEFEFVKAMAEGTKRPSFVKRRSPAIELRPVEEVPEVEQFTKLVQDALALEKPSRFDARADTLRPNRRLMRRLYTDLLGFCSKLEWNESFKKWESVWGNRLQGINSQVSSEAADLFAGVDASGKVPQQQSELHDVAAQKHNADLKARLKDYQKSKPKKERHTTLPFYTEFLPPDHPIRKAAGAN
ncbi:hypothetical protein BU23DRAFT_269498 [Bimuria novae-zelandiae CBS 107.79]|uniref:LYR motif-containing protein Cup1-like N-terminal domain-containing protein n=1 Tax=Bimuria novae-zelandiae CBS 107.79 TaxID=1447943 RepID=A0A6A5UWB5_9PLEO|nr:hypothetical protein BU23DRAFT_269498 [Bimuria novae-zelandiae CBS 107.79]